MSRLVKKEFKKHGDNYKSNKNYEEAIKSYTKAIEIDPSYTDAYNGRGLAYFNQGKHEEAIENYQKAIEIDPNYKYAYYNMGRELKEQGKYKEAIENYTKAIEIDPSYTGAYNGRGLAYFNQGKHEEAIENYQKAIEIDPNYKYAYYNMGRDLKEQGKYKEAIENYTKAIEIDPSYTDAYNGRGSSYYNQGKNEEALKNYKKAVAIDPNYKYAYYNMGLVHDRQGKYKEAIENYKEAVKIDKGYEKAYKKIEKANGKLKNNKEIEEDSYQQKTIKIKFRDEKFYKYIERTEESIEKKEQIYDLFLAVIELKEKLLYKDTKAVGHYTKVSNLKHLIKPSTNEDSENEKLPRLRLNNVSYMNDPTEGEVFITLLNQYSEGELINVLNKVYNNQSENCREVLNGKNHVFLVSFSTAIDTSLPMWVQYSENGEGCCLVFDSVLFFDKEDKNSFIYGSNEEDEEDEEDGENEEIELTVDLDMNTGIEVHAKTNKKTYYCLYKIIYVKNEYNKYALNDTDVGKLIKKIGDLLMPFREELEKRSNSTLKGIIQNILDQVRFLFKDENYEHEEEVRLVEFEDNGNVKYTGDAEGFRVPHVYIELDRELELEEVILGPKVLNAIEISNYLYYTDRVKEVSRSRIKYK